MSRKRRQTSWEAGPYGTAAFTGDGAALIQALTGSLTLPDSKVTLARVRGAITVANTNNNAAGDRAIICVGIGIVPVQGPAAGITSIPTPYSDMGWDGWLWHKQFVPQTAAASVNLGQITANFEAEIDSKAMRKWELSEMAIYLAAEQALTSTAGTFANRVWCSTRLLLMLD